MMHLEFIKNRKNRKEVFNSILVMATETMNIAFTTSFHRESVHKWAKTLVRGKAPSLDGVVFEFFVIFWHVI
jgi:hypothetical protein